MAAAAAAAASGETEAAAALAAVDSAASCPICHSLIDTPLLLKSCGHSYCSTCIRQNLAFQERSGPPSCPTCRKPCDARDLLPNAALREVLDKYAAARPLLLAAAEAAAQAPVVHGAASNGRQQGRSAQRQTGCKRTRQQQQEQRRRRQADEDEDEEEAEASPARRRTRSASGAKAGAQAAKQPAGKVYIDLAADSSSGWSEGDASEPEPSSGDDKAVPSFFINSHVDLCLVGGNQPSKAAGGSGAGSSRHGPAAAAAAANKGPFQPLAVPPKLVPSLTTEKSLRQLLRKYSMNTDGKKKELLDRYSKLRLAVEMANDKQERVTYEQLAKRVSAQERQMAAVQLLQPAAKAVPAVTAAVAGAAGRTAAAAAAAADAPGQSSAQPAAGTAAGTPAAQQVDIDSVTDPAAIILTGCSYRELIAVTRQRDAVRRRLRQQAVAAAEQQQQQQQQPGERQEQPEPLPCLGQGDAAGQQQEQQLPRWSSLSLEDEDLMDDSSDAWDAGLPLSQQQQPEWQKQRRERQQARQHRLAVSGGDEQPQQEQHPPNSSGDLTAAGAPAAGAPSCRSSLRAAAVGSAADT
ncbi:hypothetical protein ABPG75_000065 [Micractinium tetrahymenae]